MKTIQLANNKGIVLVDDEDYKFLNSKKWFLSGVYARTGYKIKGKSIKKPMHYYLIDIPKGYVVDHIDRNGLNYQKENLRAITHHQNLMNRNFKGGTSKYKGVSLIRKTGKWTATIKFNYKTYHLGNYDDEKDAARAYDEKAKKFFGEFAYLNGV